jgi:hypothetical protein
MNSMKKVKIEEVIHLYLGCEVQINKRITEAEKVILSGVYTKQIEGGNTENVRCQLFTSPGENIIWLDFDEFKLRVRRLSSMTEEEAREFCKLEGWGENLENVIVTDGVIDFKRIIGERTETCITRFTRCRPEMFLWLLSKRFWLFSESAFEKGLIIDVDEK